MCLTDDIIKKGTYVLFKSDQDKSVNKGAFYEVIKTSTVVIFVQFNLEFHINIGGSGMFSKGHFYARKNTEIPKVAYSYLKNIKRETGYRTMILEKVILNGTEDITKEIKKLMD